MQKRGGSDIFVHEKRGGGLKNFVQYKYIPARHDPAVP